MRWDSTVTLVERTHELDARGVPRVSEETAEVPCNEFTVGAETWQFYREQGVSDVAEVQVRSIDYAGQLHAAYGGKPYTVDRAQRQGDFTRLTLRRQASDALPEGAGA